MARKRDPQPYLRGSWWWGPVYHADGRRELMALKLPSTVAKGHAKKVRDALERKVQASERLGDVPQEGPITVEQYARHWMAERKKQDLVQQDETRLAFFLEQFGRIELSELSWTHVREAVLAMVALCGPGEDQLSTTTVRTRVTILGRMLREALEEGRILTNPCKHQKVRDVIPKRRPKRPGAKARQRFKRHEVEALISDERIPEERRIRYALLAFTGMRVGEGCNRRWWDYDERMSPLGELLITNAFSRARKRESTTKTGAEKRAPVHPTLAKMLAAWKLGGWQRLVGRAPKPGDFILARPSDGGRISYQSYRQGLVKDLERLELPYRGGTHAWRRTFVTLARESGARVDMLRPITHAEKQDDMMALYSDISWEALCAEVAKVQVELREPKLLPLRAVASAAVSVCNLDLPTERLLQQVLHGQGSATDEPDSGELRAGNEVVFRTARSEEEAHGAASSTADDGTPGGCGSGGATEDPQAPPGCNNVAERPAPSDDELTASIERIRAHWQLDRDREALRSQLAALLESLGGEVAR